jgi:hypothetical protein
MKDEQHALFRIDRITSVDELTLVQRGFKADGDATPKIERLIEARLAYLDVWDAAQG